MKQEEIRLINIGYGNVVVLNHIVGVVAPYSAPIQRFIKWLKKERPELLIDATYGNKCRSVIQTDCGFVYLSAILPQTIAIKLIKVSNDEHYFTKKIKIREGEEVSVDVSDGEEEESSD